MKKCAHVTEVRDWYAYFSNFTVCKNMVWVVPSLCGKVEGYGQPCLTFGQVGAVQLIRCRSSGMAGIGSHQPWVVTTGSNGVSHVSSMAMDSPFLYEKALWLNGCGQKREVIGSRYGGTTERGQMVRIPLGVEQLHAVKVHEVNEVHQGNL